MVRMKERVMETLLEGQPDEEFEPKYAPKCDMDEVYLLALVEAREIFEAKKCNQRPFGTNDWKICDEHGLAIGHCKV